MATFPFTYNQVVKFFSDFADNHYQINSFGDGDLAETMESDIANHVKFPKLWMRPLSANISKPFATIRIGLLIMDLVNKDQSNQDEVLSDTFSMMQDVIATMNAPTYASTFILGKSATLTPFTERFSSQVTGWAMEFDVQILETEDRCAVPISGSPSFSSTCLPVTIYNPNGSVNQLVPSGGSYTIVAGAGVDIIDQDGNVVSHVADGGTYSVLVFDTISGGASNTTYSNNVISA